MANSMQTYSNMILSGDIPKVCTPENLIFHSDRTETFLRKTFERYLSSIFKKNCAEKYKTEENYQLYRQNMLLDFDIFKTDDVAVFRVIQKGMAKYQICTRNDFLLEYTVNDKVISMPLKRGLHQIWSDIEPEFYPQLEREDNFYIASNAVYSRRFKCFINVTYKENTEYYNSNRALSSSFDWLFNPDGIKPPFVTEIPCSKQSIHNKCFYSLFPILDIADLKNNSQNYYSGKHCSSFITAYYVNFFKHALPVLGFTAQEIRFVKSRSPLLESTEQSLELKNLHAHFFERLSQFAFSGPSGLINNSATIALTKGYVEVIIKTFKLIQLISAIKQDENTLANNWSSFVNKFKKLNDAALEFESNAQIRTLNVPEQMRDFLGSFNRLSDLDFAKVLILINISEAMVSSRYDQQYSPRELKCVSSCLERYLKPYHVNFFKGLNQRSKSSSVTILIYRNWTLFSFFFILPKKEKEWLAQQLQIDIGSPYFEQELKDNIQYYEDELYTNGTIVDFRKVSCLLIRFLNCSKELLPRNNKGLIYWLLSMLFNLKVTAQDLRLAEKNKIPHLTLTKNVDLYNLDHRISDYLQKFCYSLTSMDFIQDKVSLNSTLAEVMKEEALYHDDVVNILNLKERYIFKHGLNNKSERKTVEAPSLIKARVIDDVKVTPLITKTLLDNESLIMNHCVASYIGSVYRGESFIFHLENEQTKERSTVEYVYYDNEFNIRQHQGVHNTDPTKTLKAVARKLLYILNQKYSQKSGVLDNLGNPFDFKAYCKELFAESGKYIESQCNQELVKLTNRQLAEAYQSVPHLKIAQRIIKANRKAFGDDELA